ncbi:MAG: type II toxin-antitoxin system RelE/ParE family toxin [Elusimicrobia bacterium]|nr:type II toxin-antitoxin system RelE/ParE family toxin [Elusimicrobiota bacterium]
MNKTTIIYKTKTGKEPFVDWFLSIRDKVTRYRIQARIRRIEYGNYGDHKRFHGLIEIRIDFGKGYRVYCAEDGNVIVILLMGGDKSTQEKDIKLAQELREDYYEQKKTQNIR